MFQKLHSGALSGNARCGPNGTLTASYIPGMSFGNLHFFVLPLPLLLPLRQSLHHLRIHLHRRGVPSYHMTKGVVQHPTDSNFEQNFPPILVFLLEPQQKNLVNRNPCVLRHKHQLGPLARCQHSIPYLLGKEPQQPPTYRSLQLSRSSPRIFCTS